MTALDVWQIYGSREDTDAVVIRHMQRLMEEAERTTYQVQKTNEELRLAITEAGFRFRSDYGKRPRLEKLDEESK